MTSIAKLKDKARKHEQKEDWQSAIKVYQRVLERQADADHLDLDLGLYNRIGDLNLRIGQVDEAVSYYEQAADKYAELGFYNNAIALCNKALRHRPERLAIYLKLSRLCTEQGFETDARRWILEYAERKLGVGEVEAALEGLEEFAELSDDPEVRELLARQMASHGRPGEALDQLRKAYGMRIHAGETGKAAEVAAIAREIDPGVNLEEEPVYTPEPKDELPGLDSAHILTDEVSGRPTGEEEAEGVAAVEGAGPDEEEATGLAETLEPTAAEAPETAAPTDELEGLERHEDTVADADVVGVEGLESVGGAAVDDEIETEEVSGLEVSSTPEQPMELESDIVGGLETFGPAGTDDTRPADEVLEEYDDEEEPEPLPLLDTGYDEEPEAEAGPPTDVAELDAETEEEAEPLPLLDTGLDELEPAAEVDEPEFAEEAVEDVAEAAAQEPEIGGVEAEAVEAKALEEADAEPEIAGVEAEAVDEEALADAGQEAVVMEVPGTPVDEAPGDGEVAEEDFDTPEEDLSGEPLELTFDVPGAGPVDAGAAMDMAPAEAMDLEAGSFDAELEEDAETDPDAVEALDVQAVVDRARELVGRGLEDEALEELRLLARSDAGASVFRDALAVVDEIVRRNQNHLAALQRRVEYGARIGDRKLLVGTYLDLAEALSRLGAETKAHVMYRRVLGLDPSNPVAQAALGEPGEDETAADLAAALEAEPEEPAAAAPAAERDTDPNLAAMLDQFRAKVTESPDEDDPGDHYDLGLAFKEMGLIDEAIAEFRTALTGGEERLKVYEELGQCFILKEQYNVAVKVLGRALKVPHTSDAELLGVYYQLGQCYEELGKREDARKAYQRVLAIDDSFADVPDRMARL